MTIRRIALLTLLAAAAAPALAASPFDGTWKADMATAKLPDTPDVFAVAGGTFTCTSCVPSYSVPADSAFHAAPGHPGYDTVSVTLADPHTVVRSYRKGDKLVAIATDIVSADGQKLHYVFADLSAPTGVPTVAIGDQTRIATGPAGGHALSGSWQLVPGTAQATDNALVATIAVTDRVVHFSMPTGISYAAPIGGAPVPIKGDITGTMVAMASPAPNVLVETDTVAGKVEVVNSMTVSADRRTIAMVSDDRRRNEKTSFTLVRQ